MDTPTWFGFGTLILFLITTRLQQLPFKAMMNDVTGEYSTLFAPYLGAVGAFFSGSNTVSNLTFGSVQLSTAEITGISTTLVLALQSVGGAMGNMVCINNILAVRSVLNIENQEGLIIKKTVVPMFIYGVIAALVAVMIIPLIYEL
ncbi:hypothetical protein A6041_03040 [[Haemophilus] ducreyi]|nr:hypothetical protein A6041_03040 [[Haemophilus] ducreyi]ANF68518.1 hypothetical protein A6042_00295 [[Haemophilus] ducreyi]